MSYYDPSFLHFMASINLNSTLAAQGVGLHINVPRQIRAPKGLGKAEHIRAVVIGLRSQKLLFVGDRKA
ncbi:hypothetical protein PuT2_15435 [Pusillimonas sp. T2]|nr:hypothetical protein PuT2_15435 [Pusillimonas sp. T2]